MKAQFVLLARYNQWMNEALYTKAREMTDNDLYADKGAFFGSAFHTLSHIYTGDLLWLARFTSVKSAVDLDKGLGVFPTATSNKVHFCSTLDDLENGRKALDALILEWVEGIDATEFEGHVTYRNLSGAMFSDPLPSVLLHFFNHQTHHRGQFTTLLSQSGESDYFTDLIGLLRE
ncbi:damage-inducible protein DinB [Enterovibrio sp. ZSDZ35]|uniref:Damage-inducible protein DinB n=1 Tax=Enterovibrio qingdaonensis TaxID=2899818 RepID=A0ABT5QPG8_9GAMM|nr:DinB family protein [Enterovibrio sp. ZSDZ35]MDD1782878.1 damage-inducible protein DinB [Enterovibrio sp. ZSDZ35]